MKNSDAIPPYETLEIGTPSDYTSDLYRVYFELRDQDNVARNIFAQVLGDERAENLVCLAHGYEAELPIQCVPEIVRLLVAESIAVYQVVRYAKTNSTRN